MSNKTNTVVAPSHLAIDPLAVAVRARAARDAYVGKLIARAAGAVAAWFRRRRTIAALEQLDERMLADIGLDRAAFAAGVIRRTDDERIRAYTRAPSGFTRRGAHELAARVYAPDLAAANDARRVA